MKNLNVKWDHRGCEWEWFFSLPLGLTNNHETNWIMHIVNADFFAEICIFDRLCQFLSLRLVLYSFWLCVDFLHALWSYLSASDIFCQLIWQNSQYAALPQHVSIPSTCFIFVWATYLQTLTVAVTITCQSKSPKKSPWFYLKKRMIYSEL